MSLRKRIADSPRVNLAIARAFAGYIRWVYRTNTWDRAGWDEVAKALETHGAVIIAGWHQRSFMSPYMFDVSKAPCQSLTSRNRPGRFAGLIQQQFGFESTPMHLSGSAAVEGLRSVLRGLRRGVSIAIAFDGPQGPARVAKPAPVQWARVSGKPVFVYAYSCSWFLFWPTWDRLMFPLPYGRGHMRWERWEAEVPANLGEEGMPELIADLNAFTDAVTERADRAAGHSAPRL